MVTYCANLTCSGAGYDQNFGLKSTLSVIIFLTIFSVSDVDSPLREYVTYVNLLSSRE